MSERLFLQFQQMGNEQLLWFLSSDGQIKENGRVALSELNALALRFSSTDVIALIPADDCLVTQITLPTSQRRQQLKAIPFALEEQIADDIDNMHFSMGKRLENGRLPVVAIAKNRIQQWLTILSTAGISVSALLPLSALLDTPDDAWSIFQQDDLFLINQNGDCWTATADDAAMMLQLSLQNIADDELPNLIFWGVSNAPDWVTGLGLNCSSQSISNPHQDLLARYNQQCINLLQGDFAIQDDWIATWAVWRKVAVLVTTVLLLKFSLMGFDLFRLNEEQNFLKTEIARTYHLVAPGARIVDAKRQMTQLLKQNRSTLNESSSFLIMLTQLGEGLASIPGIRPTNLNYNSSRGEIRLDLLVSSLPLLDKLKSNLVDKGLSIEVGGASAQGSDYSGRLIIRSGL